jgi:hypothetical protein
MRNFPLIFLLLTTLACTTGDSDKVRPVGESTAVSATNPDTVISQPAPAATTPAKKAQRAWDTAATESFDVEELNRRRAEWIEKNKPPSIDTVRIKPTDFPGLPEEIASWLEEKGYIIPKSIFYPNVICGSYMSKGQQDIAVLAMRNTFMDVLVFEKGKTAKVHTLLKDEPGLWGLEKLYHSAPDSTVKLLNGIVTFGTDLIQQFYESYDWPEPPETSHQAVRYWLLEESSIIFYYYNGVWLRINKGD